jgi:hypothetical protein
MFITLLSRPSPCHLSPENFQRKSGNLSKIFIDKISQYQL